MYCLFDFQLDCRVDELGLHSVLEGPVNITEWTEGEGAGGHTNGGADIPSIMP